MNVPRLFAIALVLATPTCALAASFTHSLAIGSRGPEVTSLQEMLFAQGYFKVSARGYFGPLTKQAVMAFQKGNGLEPVGSVGPKTRAILNALVSSGGASTQTSIPQGPGVTSVPGTNASTSASTSVPVITSTAPAATSTASSTTSTPVAQNATSTSSSDLLTVTVLSPPSVLPANTNSTTLTVATSKNANCRWGTNQSMQLSNMTSFVMTGGTTHSYTFTNLSNGSLYVYYVKCQDSASLYTTPDTVVSFSVAQH